MSEISDEMVEAYRQAAIRCSAATYSAPYHDDCCPRAGLAAVYPLLRAQIREEVARDIGAAMRAESDRLAAPSEDRSLSPERRRNHVEQGLGVARAMGAVVRAARGVAADGTEQMTVEQAQTGTTESDGRGCA